MDVMCYYMRRKINTLFFILLLLTLHKYISFAGVLYRNPSQNKSSILFSSLISTKMDLTIDEDKDSKINIKKNEDNIKEDEKNEEEEKEIEEIEEIENKNIKEDNIKKCEVCNEKIKELNFEICYLYGGLVQLSFNINKEKKDAFYAQCRKIYDILRTIQELLSFNFKDNKYQDFLHFDFNPTSYKELLNIIQILLNVIVNDHNDIFLSGLIEKKDIFYKYCEEVTNDDPMKTLTCFLKSFCNDKIINSLRFVVAYNRNKMASYFKITFNKIDGTFMSLAELLKDICIKITNTDNENVEFTRYNKKEIIKIDNTSNRLPVLIPKKQNTFSISIKKDVDVSNLSVIIYSTSSQEEISFSNFKG